MDHCGHMMMMMMMMISRKCQGLGAVVLCCMVVVVVALLMLPGCFWWWHSHVSTISNTAVLPCLPRAWLSVAQARVALLQAYQVLPPSMVRNGTAMYQTAWQTWQATAAEQAAVMVTLHFVHDENGMENDEKLASTATTTTIPRSATRVAALVPQVARRPLRWLRHRRRRKDLESPPDDMVVVENDKQENATAITAVSANSKNNNQEAQHWFPVVVRQSLALDDEVGTAAVTDPVTIQYCTIGTVQTCDDDAVAIPSVPPKTLSSSTVLPHQMSCGTALWERLLGSSSALDAADHGTTSSSSSHNSYYLHLEQTHAYALRAPLVWDLVGKHPSSSKNSKNSKKQNNEAWLVHLLSTWPSPLLPLMIRWYKDDNDDVDPTTFAVQPNDNNTVTTTPPSPALPKLWKKLGYLILPAGEDENESQFVALRIVLNTGY